ncbi:hypothetical protein EMGBS3_06950 [Anaerolineaceae bacterium]|nr:hypothetical protein EMGBS3_06950 [Anaerolineaceae bacterium]
MAIRFGPSAATRCAPRSSTPPWCTTIAPRSSAPTPGACVWTTPPTGRWWRLVRRSHLCWPTPAHHYGLILLDTLLVTLFVWIEARRYRYYELWSHRVRLMETDFLPPCSCRRLRPARTGREPGRKPVAAGLFPSACGRRSGAAIAATICGILPRSAGCLDAQSFLHPLPAASWAEFMQRSAIGPIPAG